MSRTLAACLVLAVVTLGAYWQVTDFEFIALDDPDYVSRNSRVQGGLTIDGIAWALTTYHASNWHPVTWISYMVDVELFGHSAAAHHGVNLLLHTLNALLLFAALRSMTASFWPSVLVAALFALHPINVESVAWVSARKSTLSTTFWLGIVLAYTFYARRGGFLRHATVTLLLVLGLMTKPMMVTVPLTLLLLDYWPLERLGRDRSRWRIGTPTSRSSACSS